LTGTDVEHERNVSFLQRAPDPIKSRMARRTSSRGNCRNPKGAAPQFQCLLDFSLRPFRFVQREEADGYHPLIAFAEIDDRAIQRARTTIE
jgi:hypothetical protein